MFVLNVFTNAKLFILNIGDNTNGLFTAPHDYWPNNFTLPNQ